MLNIHSIFKSIQGEGPFAGTPAVFVRFAGCNMLPRCSFCDTDYTTGAQMMEEQQIIDEIKRLAGGHIKLVVITGGEPFMQGFGKLVYMIKTDSLPTIIQIETNGTIYQPNFPYSFVHIVCSPKHISVADEFLKYTHILAWKFLVDETSEDPAKGMGISPDWVFIQPIDTGDSSKNTGNIKRAVALCLENGYHLSLQLHKVISIP